MLSAGRTAEYTLGEGLGGETTACIFSGVFSQR